MTPSHDDSQDSKLDALIAEYLRAVDAGEAPDQAAFLAAHPDQAEGLRSFFRDLAQMAGVGELAPCPSAHKTGDLLLERYRLDALIGEGGFGEVWRGFDQQLRRPVAIKLPKRALSPNAEVAPFLSEARRVARLSHSSIVDVYDVGRTGADCFIVSKFIDGWHLGDYVRIHQPTIEEIGRLIADAADALAYAHSQGFVHRDVKPSNLLVDRRDHIYLADFGIASSVTETDSSPMAGTLNYMAPEQLTGEAILDRRPCDIYSLGVVLYELLTGRRPYDATSVNELRAQIQSESPPLPSSIDPSIPGKWDAIVYRCLAKSPGDRFPNAEEMVAACRRHQKSTTPVLSKFRQSLVIAFLFAFGIGGGIATQGDERLHRMLGGAIFAIATIAAAIVFADPSKFRATAVPAEELEGVPRPGGLRKGEWQDRYQRFRILRDSGKHPHTHFTAVVDLLHITSEECRQEIIEWLVAAGPEAVPALIVALRESNTGSHDFRRAIIMTLGRYGADARDAIPVLEYIRRDTSLVRFVDYSLHRIRRTSIPWPKIAPILLGSILIISLVYTHTTSVGATTALLTLLMTQVVAMACIGVQVTQTRNWRFVVSWLIFFAVGIWVIASFGSSLASFVSQVADSIRVPGGIRK